MTLESANLYFFKHKMHQWIPLNALFPNTFLLFVYAQIIIALKLS